MAIFDHELPGVPAASPRHGPQALRRDSGPFCGGGDPVRPANGACPA